MLEETRLAYEPHRIDITAGESYDPAFLPLNPNCKRIAIYDPDEPSGAPDALFESGTMLRCLAAAKVFEPSARATTTQPSQRGCLASLDERLTGRDWAMGAVTASPILRRSAGCTA